MATWCINSICIYGNKSTMDQLHDLFINELFKKYVGEPIPQNEEDKLNKMNVDVISKEDEVSCIQVETVEYPIEEEWYLTFIHKMKDIDENFIIENEYHEPSKELCGRIIFKKHGLVSHEQFGNECEICCREDGEGV